MSRKVDRNFFLGKSRTKSIEISPHQRSQLDRIHRHSQLAIIHKTNSHINNQKIDGKNKFVIFPSSKCGKILFHRSTILNRKKTCKQEENILECVTNYTWRDEVEIELHRRKIDLQSYLSAKVKHRARAEKQF